MLTCKEYIFSILDTKYTSIHYLQATDHFVIRLKLGEPQALLKLSLFGFVAILNLILSNQLYFHLVMIIINQLCMVAPQLNHQIILLLKRPLTHYWTSPLSVKYIAILEGIKLT